MDKKDSGNFLTNIVDGLVSMVSFGSPKVDNVLQRFTRLVIALVMVTVVLMLFGWVIFGWIGYLAPLVPDSILGLSAPAAEAASQVVPQAAAPLADIPIALE